MGPQPWPSESSNGLVEVADGGAEVLTGIALGLVSVTVAVHTNLLAHRSSADPC